MSHARPTAPPAAGPPALNTRVRPRCRRSTRITCVRTTADRRPCADDHAPPPSARGHAPATMNRGPCGAAANGSSSTESRTLATAGRQPCTDNGARTTVNGQPVTNGQEPTRSSRRACVDSHDETAVSRQPCEDSRKPTDTREQSPVDNRAPTATPCPLHADHDQQAATCARPPGFQIESRTSHVPLRLARPAHPRPLSDGGSGKRPSGAFPGIPCSGLGSPWPDAECEVWMTRSSPCAGSLSGSPVGGASLGALAER